MARNSVCICLLCENDIGPIIHCRCGEENFGIAGRRTRWKPGTLTAMETRKVVCQVCESCFPCIRAFRDVPLSFGLQSIMLLPKAAPLYDSNLALHRFHFIS